MDKLSQNTQQNKKQVNIIYVGYTTMSSNIYVSHILKWKHTLFTRKNLISLRMHMIMSREQGDPHLKAITHIDSLVQEKHNSIITVTS